MKIIKNLLSEVDVASINKIISGNHWGYGYVSNDVLKPIWNFDKDAGRKIVDIMMTVLPEYNLDDYHINGQTQLQQTALHTDDSMGSSHALVYFPTVWDYTWGGRLHIIKNNTANIITPEYNTAVLFDASTPHYTEAPTVNQLRVSIGLKLSV
jgi:hypothetical protein